MAREKQGTVMLIDDDPLLRRSVARILEPRGYAVHLARSSEAAIADLARETTARPDVVLADLQLPGMSGIDMVHFARRRLPSAKTIVITGRASVSSAVEAMRSGAFDFLLKPLDSPTILSAVERAMMHKREEHRRVGLVGTSAPMQRLVSKIERVGPSEASVLVTGESGVGKELVARALHETSRRRTGRLVSINCAAFAESVLESELFGHERGAFTGAHARRTGVFEEADGGTLFLDEVGELPPTVQVRLLRVLQEREVRPLGSNENRPIDIRVVAATNRDLTSDIVQGRFRKDLFFRLNVVSIVVPPLRDRLGDLPLLVDHFLAKHARRHGRSVRQVTPGVVAALRERSWPGNVRELENMIERAVVLSESDTITERELEDLAESDREAAPSTVAADEPAPIGAFAEAKRTFEVQYLTTLLARAGGRLTVAERIAGLDRTGLRRLLRRHRLEVK